MTSKQKNILTILAIIATTIGLYYGIYCSLKKYFMNSQQSFKSNEFGEFFGGVLNPLFTLISTISVIYLTYIISKSEDKKADIAIETQKRLTLNQMRQTALENLIQKTNLYVHEFDRMSIYDAKGKYHQNLLTRMIEDENKSKGNVIVWLIILNELENFKQLKYLFAKLFEQKNFIEVYEKFINITSKLHGEQNDMKFISTKSISEYLNNQEEFLTIIGNYIYSEF